MASLDQFVNHLKTTNSRASKNQNSIQHILRFLKTQGKNELTTQKFIELIHVYLQSKPTATERNQFLLDLNAQINTFSNKHPTEIDQASIGKLLSQQVITIENSFELVTLIGKYLSRHKNKKKIKLKVLNDTQVMALILDDDSQLEVRVYSNKVKLQSGKLFPLMPVTRLYYDEHMELKRGETQLLASEDYFHSFTLVDQQIKGFKLSPRDGLIKQTLAGPLNHESDIFFLLKSNEKNYIDLASDPFYQELCSKIDLAIDSLKSKEPQALLLAKKSIKLAYLALKYVFDDDNYLKYKLLELERTIKSEVQWVKQSQEKIQS